MEIYFQLVSFLFIVLLVFIYFSKCRLNKNSNKFFKKLLVFSLLGTILAAAGTFFNNNLLLNGYLVYHIIWLIIYFCYVISVIEKYKYIANESLYDKHLNIISKIGIIASLISLVVLFILPIFSTDLNNYISLNRFDVYHVISLFLLLFSCIVITFNYHVLSKNKYLVLLLITLIETIFVLVGYYFDLIFTPLDEILILYLIYFNIENLDLKTIENLVIAKEQAEKSNLKKNEFLTTMSHQIRTPINVIDGLSQVIDELDDIDSIKDNAKDIRIASNNLVSLVNGILDISLLEAGSIKINNSNYEVYEMLENVIELTKSKVIKKNLEIKANISDTIPTVLYGDSERIKQALLNLFDNAIKFTKSGSIELKVTSTISGSLCRLKMSVKDTGIGISKGDIHKLFEKFGKLNDSSLSVGNGLGLAITKNIVDLMGGKIDVESEKDLGSIFTITIDQKIISNVTKKEVVAHYNDEEVKVFDASGKKVLVVDDNRLNIKVISKILQSYNIEIVSCTSGQECLDILEKNQNFDLILMDDMMPNMSGIETLEILKKLARVSGFSIPVVVLTANAVTGMKEEYLKKGFDDYLAKPIEKPELNRVLKRFLK